MRPGKATTCETKVKQAVMRTETVNIAKAMLQKSSNRAKSESVDVFSCLRLVCCARVASVRRWSY